MQDSLPIVILSTADMDAPVWTNKQHIAIRLSKTRSVYYIESMGLRRPTASVSDIKRVVRRAGSIVLKSFRQRLDNSTKPRQEVVNDVTIISPMVLPFHGSRIARTANRVLIKRNLCRKLPPQYILWSFSPITYGLEDRAVHTFYHSVDLLHTIDGVPSEALLMAEQNLVSRASAVIASSAGVAAHLKSEGARPLLWENVADIGLFSAGRQKVRRRRAVFVGNITPSKVDFDLLFDLLERGVQLCLAGPINIDGSGRDDRIDELLSSPLVEYAGVLSQAEMANVLGSSWVGIIPYQVNKYTDGVFPMKVYEYLSAGLPVVTTPLSSIAGREIDGLKIASGPEFGALVCEILARSDDLVNREFPGLQQNSWEARIAQIERLIDGHLGVGVI